MSSKEDLCAALECRRPDGAVPIWEIHFHCWNQASGRHFVVGQEFADLSSSAQAKAVAANAEIMLSVAQDLHFAGVTIPDGYWEVGAGQPCYYWLPQEARLKLARTLHDMAGSSLMVVGACGGIIGMPGSSEYLEFSYKLFDAPEEIDERARKALSVGIEGARKLRDAGVEAVYCGADIADNHGPFFSPAQMDRFILPYLHCWAESTKGMGLYAMLHTDGDLDPILTDLAESGIHALQAIDPVAGMDIRKVKDRVGDRLCLCGNVDCGLLYNGPASEIYESTRDLIRDCMAGGGFVLGASNAVVHQTPIAHYREVIRAWQDFGRYAPRTDQEG